MASMPPLSSGEQAQGNRNDGKENNDRYTHDLPNLHLEPIDDDDDGDGEAFTASKSDFDSKVFHQVVVDAGRWAYGVVMVEVWVMNGARTHLVRPRGGLWIDPLAHDYGSNETFVRLLDPSRDDFFRPLPFSPGVGLPGILWTEAREGNAAVSSVGTTTNPAQSLRSPFPTSSPRNEQSLNRNNRSINSMSRSWSNNTNGSRSRNNNTNNSRGRHRRGQSMHFDVMNKSELHDGNEDEEGAGSKIDTVSSTPTAVEVSDDKEKDNSAGHRRSPSDIEGGWAATSSSGRLGGGTGDRVKNAMSRHRAMNSGDVHWRDIAALANDPDQPFNPRVQYLQECGLGWAAGVPFRIGSTEGVVVYMARKTSSVEKLMDTINEEYLTHSSLVIGSVCALRRPRLVLEIRRRIETEATILRVKSKFKAIRAMNRQLDTFVEETAAEGIEGGVGQRAGGPMFWKSDTSGVLNSILAFLKKKASSTYNKSSGGQVKPSPGFTWEESTMTFIATLLTLLVLTNINHFLLEAFGPDYGLVLGPFGAMSTLLYSLTSAPASQPRNAILGQASSLLIAYGFGLTGLDERLKLSLGTSISIAFMAKTGLTHPPAGASAMLFSGGSYTIAQVFVMLMGCVVAILLATLFNNLDSKRQYPTSWGHLFGICTDIFCEESLDSGLPDTLYQSATHKQHPIKTSTNHQISAQHEDALGVAKSVSDQSNTSAVSSSVVSARSLKDGDGKKSSGKS